MDLYRDNILDHYKHPRNFGVLDKPDKSQTGQNASCGDVIRIDIKLNKSGNAIKGIRFSGNGCAISQASASMLTEKVLNMGIVDVKKLKFKDIEILLGTDLTPSRVKCAALPLEVLLSALVK